jgi:biotin synthase
MNAAAPLSSLRHDWTRQEIEALFALPFNDLLFRAAGVHRQHFDPNVVQVSTLLSIKTGACPEDCKYCPQSNRYDTGLEPEKLMEVQKVIEEAKAAKAQGSTRLCMGAAWRSPKKKDMPYVTAMVRGVKELGLETCMTLGMLTREQADELSAAGLDYYNHNLDTSPEFYGEIITTRTYGDRLNKVEGTPLAEQANVDSFDFIRTIAVARILMPQSHVRLSAGREAMNEEMHALAYFAGANSIFYGEKLLTTPNPEANKDLQLFDRLGIRPEQRGVEHCEDDTEEQLQQRIEEARNDKFFYDATRRA